MSEKANESQEEKTQRFDTVAQTVFKRASEKRGAIVTISPRVSHFEHWVRRKTL